MEKKDKSSPNKIFLFLHVQVCQHMYQGSSLLGPVPTFLASVSRDVRLMFMCVFWA
jgi:hypothetical protein